MIINVPDYFDALGEEVPDSIPGMANFGNELFINWFSCRCSGEYPRVNFVALVFIRGM